MKSEEILESIKILYVEDDKNVRETVSDSLRLFNIDFSAAVDGADGVKKFKKGKYDLIWSGKNGNNKSVSSGVYFYKLDVNGKTKAVKKCLLLK